MTTLDFSQLTDDQLVTLIREACQEAVSRNPAVAAASRSAVLDESEKARIRTEAGEREAARLRALERERIAKEAAAEVRCAAEAAEQQNKKAQKEVADKAAQTRIDEAGKLAAQAAALREAKEAAWIQEAATLVDREPSTISLNYFKSRYGVRVLINPSVDLYDDSHLVDWNADTNTIKTSRALMSRKPQLIEFCARFRAAYRGGDYGGPGKAFLAGDNYVFGKEQSNGHANS